jgi:hypothetical protein
MSMARLSMNDYIANEARHAISDVRQRLFEEAWCGRPGTSQPTIDLSPARDAERTQPSLEELWNGRANSKSEQEIAPERDSHELER